MEQVRYYTIIDYMSERKKMKTMLRKRTATR